MSRPTPLSRRGLLGGGLAALTLTGLGGCDGDSAPALAVDGAADMPTGPWTWTETSGRRSSSSRRRPGLRRTATQRPRS